VGCGGDYFDAAGCIVFGEVVAAAEDVVMPDICEKCGCQIATNTGLRWRFEVTNKDGTPVSADEREVFIRRATEFANRMGKIIFAFNE
jgi:hypothetical protein